LPIIGNLLDIPKKFSWLAYSKFSKAHGTLPHLPRPNTSLLTKMTGDILAFHVFGNVIVVLNTAKAAKDLFEKRSAIYSDRPPMPFYDMYVSSFMREIGSQQLGWSGIGFCKLQEATNAGAKHARSLTVAFAQVLRPHIARLCCRGHVYSFPGYWKAPTNGKIILTCQ
jgi:hypothetical protein